MQKILFTAILASMIVALSGCVVSDPYSAQWYPTPYSGGYGYNVPYYGYGQGFGPGCGGCASGCGGTVPSYYYTEPAAYIYPY